MKEKREQITDEQFLEQLENLTLDPKFFDHVGHVRLAWLYLSDKPLVEAVSLTNNRIKAYAESLGAKKKFNKTITHALVTIIAKRMESREIQSWNDFILNNNDLVNDCIAVLLEFYTSALLFSEEARISVITPDIKAI